jgi:hypothetical protein
MAVSFLYHSDDFPERFFSGVMVAAKIMNKNLASAEWKPLMKRKPCPRVYSWKIREMT